MAAGLTVGFGHCIGMCGPIVVSLSLNLQGRSGTIPQILYSFGRVMTYGVLGGIMGLTGSFTMVASRIAGFQRGVLIMTGVIIVSMGLGLGRWIPLGGALAGWTEPKGGITRGFHKLTKGGSVLSYLPLGLLLGLLPCGPVYTALLASARAGMETGSSLQGFLSGAGIMLSFGLGTVPSLLMMGKLADLGWLKRRELIYRISSVFMIGSGIYFIIKGFLF